jgi:hypothetical protein
LVLNETATTCQSRLVGRLKRSGADNESCNDQQSLVGSGALRLDPTYDTGPLPSHIQQQELAFPGTDDTEEGFVFFLLDRDIGIDEALAEQAGEFLQSLQ